MLILSRFATGRKIITATLDEFKYVKTVFGGDSCWSGLRYCHSLQSTCSFSTAELAEMKMCLCPLAWQTTMRYMYL